MIADHAVEFRWLRQRLTDLPYVGAMNMFGYLQRRRRIAFAHRQQPPIFLDVRSIVAPTKAQIERGPQTFGYAALPFWKTVQKLRWNNCGPIDDDGLPHSAWFLPRLRLQQEP